MSSGQGHRAGKPLAVAGIVITFKNFSVRISHDAYTAKIVIFHHPSRRESSALEIHRRGRPGERAGKDHASAVDQARAVLQRRQLRAVGEVEIVRLAAGERHALRKVQFIVDRRNDSASGIRNQVAVRVIGDALLGEGNCEYS